MTSGLAETVNEFSTGQVTFRRSNYFIFEFRKNFGVMLCISRNFTPLFFSFYVPNYRTDDVY